MHHCVCVYEGMLLNSSLKICAGIILKSKSKKILKSIVTLMTLLAAVTMILQELIDFGQATFCCRLSSFGTVG